jgi:hypothetical protein
VAVQALATKVALTPVLIGGASLAGRRYGHHVGGWVVGLPLTSGPVAFFLAAHHGRSFAAGAAVGMLAGTISQVAFALLYRRAAWRGAVRAALGGSAGFATATLVLTFLDWSALATFALVAAVLAAGRALARRTAGPGVQVSLPPRWDVPVRMVLATAIVVLITELAPLLGPYLAGLLSPFPVFGAVLAILTQRADGAAGAVRVLDGLLLGLLAPAIFFVVVALVLPDLGLAAFPIATAGAFAAQALSMLFLPRSCMDA